MRIFGLLYIGSSETLINSRTKSDEDRLLLYVGNALNLARSLSYHGYDFELLTNSTAFVQRVLAELGASDILKTREIPFPTSFPANLSFRSAHSKIDVFRFFASLKDSYCCLLDLDVECLSQMPPSFEQLVFSRQPLFFDISAQVLPAYGEEVIRRDLGIVAGVPLPARWAGGEFIAGDTSFFSALIEKIDGLLPGYLANASKLHHQGDEMLVSAALPLLKADGQVAADIGTLGLIHRHWSGLPKHFQAKPSDWIDSTHFIHLPQDKRFLMRRGLKATSRFGRRAFFKAYQAHVRPKQVLNFFRMLKRSFAGMKSASESIR